MSARSRPRAWRECPIARTESDRMTGCGMTAVRPTLNQQVVPRPRRPLDDRGRFCFPEEPVATNLSPKTSPNEMPPAYNAADVEACIYQRWLDADVFAPEGRGSRADRSKQ